MTQLGLRTSPTFAPQIEKIPKRRTNSARTIAHSGRRLLLESLERRQLMASEIFGSVVEDLNRNQVRDPGEDRLQGWTVFLDLNRDGELNAGEPQRVTDIDGDYSFAGLAAGTHRIVEVVPTGWIATSPLSKDVFVDVNKKTRSDFYVFGGGDISGVVWNDQDNDGFRAPGVEPGTFDEPGLANWTVYLDLNQNGIQDATEPATLTDAEGAFRFEDLPPGDYEVTEILPLGWEASRRHSTAETVAVVALQESITEFANFSDTNGGIHGSVFNDINADGVRNTNALGEFTEPGLAGWTVFLDLNANGTLDPTDTSIVTDTDGEYDFVSLLGGSYQVIEVVPFGWEVSPEQFSEQTVFVTPGDVVTAAPFANFTTANGSISGMVWNDLNHDGIRDFNTLTGVFIDPPVANWQVFIDRNRNAIRDAGEPTALTNAAGRYLFTDLQIGDYKIQQVLPTGWEVAPTFNDSQTVTVFPGAESVAAEFAVYDASLAAPGNLSGTVWNDANVNGVREVTESGLAGWTVYLDQNVNNVLDAGEPTSTTNTLGEYSFTGVAPGTVTIRMQTAAGWQPSFPATSARSTTLRGGETLSGLDFGARQVTDSGIYGTIFSDSNKNGTRDAGERGLAGLTIYIDANNNSVLDAGELSVTTGEDKFYTPAVDEAGTYSFTHLPSGVYTVRAILPPVLSATPASELAHTVSLATGEVLAGVNVAAQFRPNEIHGVKFEDLNGNHVRDAGEPPIVGAKVYLDLNRNGTHEATEPSTVTGSDGSYSFTNLSKGSYVVRMEVSSGHTQTYPTTVGGILWPTGTSNPSVGIVTPNSITTSLAQGQSHRLNVSLTLPNSGSLSDMVDVFLLFDDTGSFTGNSPIVRAAFPTIISQLQAALPGADLGFGVGRMEEYANFAFEYDSGRPFTLNQPIVSSSTPGYLASIQAALNRTTPGYGGDMPETDIEALFQVVTGRGFDGNNNGSVLDSGPAGLASTQLTPGASGDVPSFASFTPDLANNVLPAAGNVGGAGFRAGALPIILLATDTGFAYQPKGETSITGVNGVNLPLSALTQSSRATTPFNSGAGIQETITGLNALGALVIGLGTNAQANIDPRQQLESISKLTGATNQSSVTIANGTADPIAPGDPLYFQIATGFASSVAAGVANAIQNAATNVAIDIDVKASDPRVRIINHSGVAGHIGAGMTATFDVEFIGDGAPRRFDLQFVRSGTDVVLGSIPVVLGTPIQGDGYHYDELEDGEIEFEDDFSEMSSSNVPPTIVVVGPSDGYAGVTYQTRTVQLVASDSSSNGGRAFTYEAQWGDGSGVETFSDPDDILVSHKFTTTGPKTASFRAIDPDGAASDWVTLSFDILAIETQGQTLAIGGTSANNTLTITPGAAAPLATLQLDTQNLGSHSLPANGVAFYGGEGSDVVSLNGTIGNDNYTYDGSLLTWSGSASWTQALSVVTVEVERIKIQANAGNDRLDITGGVVEFQGGAGLDTLAGPNADNLWQVNASGSGMLNGVAYSTTESLLGGSGNDEFRFAATGAVSGAVRGGAGVDTFDYSGRTTAVAINLATSKATGTGSSVEIERWITGSASTDSFVNANVASSWDVAASQSVAINGQLFLQGFDSVAGGSAVDTFHIANDVVSGPKLNGGAGLDTLSYATWSTSVQVNRVANTATSIPMITGFEQFIGGSASDTMLGSNAATAWTINGPATGKAGSVGFSSFEHLVGGSLNDSFTLTNTGSIASVVGGLGVDTLTGPVANNAWTIDGVGSGTLNGATSFAQFENLTGGSLDDRFEMGQAGQLLGTLSGGAGSNTLSYAGWLSDVTVNGLLGLATGVQALALNFGILIGGAGNDSLSAVNALASVLIGNDGNDVLTGSDLRRDILVGGQGADTLVGRGGDDILFGGRTTFDADSVALKSLLAEWNSSRTYTQRVNNLKGGPITGTPLNNGNLLTNAPSDTLLDDAVADVMTGGLGNDWFIKAAEDTITDLAINELIDLP